jgi:hypothetical protein
MEYNASSFSSVSPIRASMGDVFLPAETYTTVSSIASFYEYNSFINKHGLIRIMSRRQKGTTGFMENIETGKHNSEHWRNREWKILHFSNILHATIHQFTA